MRGDKSARSNIQVLEATEREKKVSRRKIIKEVIKINFPSLKPTEKSQGMHNVCAKRSSSESLKTFKHLK